MNENIPNILTVGRLAVLPPMIVLFFLPFEWAAWTCLGLYVIGALTDFFDGWLARKYSIQSEFGVFMDPLSDKIFVVQYFAQRSKERGFYVAFIFGLGK